ncbi:MAG TPA: hypothetical protein VII11_08245, partial [Bacteroidota bacterium]
CGIRYDSAAPDSKQVLNRVVRAFAPFLQQCWVTGSDLGTGWHDIVTACRDHAGIPHPQFALMKAYGGEHGQAIEEGILRLSRGTSLPVDGSLNLLMSDAVTGWTVCVSTEEALAVMGQPLAGKRIAIQGFGAVGGSAAKFLAERGALIVAVSDELGAIVAAPGKSLDIPALLKLRKSPTRKVVDREQLQAQFQYQETERDSVLYLPADVVIPAAGSHIAADIGKIQARLIVEAANDPFTAEEEEALHQRGVTVVPDAIANSGGAGLYGLLVLGHVPVTKNALLKFLSTQVRTMTRTVLERAGSPPRLVLQEVARRQIRAHIDAGHSFLPNGIHPDDLNKPGELDVRYKPSSPYADIATDKVH